MEKLSREVLLGIYTLALNLHQSKPKEPAAATLRRQSLEWAIKLLRDHGYDARWFCEELHEKFLDLRQESRAIISDYRLQKALADLRLSELNFSLDSRQHTNVAIFAGYMEQLYGPRIAAGTRNPDDYTILSPFSTTVFYYEAATLLFWCSIDAQDLIKIIDSLFNHGLSQYAYNLLKLIQFNPVTGEHLSATKLRKKPKRRQVILEENSDEPHSGNCVNQA